MPGSCRLGLLLILILFGQGCQSEPERVTIFHAGSLAPLFQDMGDRFQRHHPRVRVESESAGSLDTLRKITELGRECDIVAVADGALIPIFLAGRIDHYFSFLGNEMVLATARKSLLQEGGPDWKSQWFELLFQKEASYGISDPDRDPAGYYAHLAWKLAEIHYNRPGLYRRFSGRLDRRWMRPKSSELIALLQTGNLDFAFLYKSSAIQNNLEFISFPPQVSLGEEAYSDFYDRVFIRIRAATPDSTLEIHGSPIRYGLATVNPSNPWAQSFVDFLFTPESQAVYRELGYSVTPVTELPVRGE